MQDVKLQTDADYVVTHYLAPFFLLGGLLVILYATLVPFQFNFRSITVAEYAAFYELFPSSLFDFPRNILLFMPYGFGLTAVLDQRGWSRKQTAIAVLISGFLLTLTVESLQQFIPNRQPSLSDLVSNTLGAVVGLGSYRLWQNRVAAGQKLTSLLLMPQFVMTGVVVYAVMLLLVAHGLATGVRLGNWEHSYNMLLGNEQTGDRPWRGTVRDLAIFNEALAGEDARVLLDENNGATRPRETLLAFYPLIGGADQEDVTGRQPDLVWRFAEAAADGERAWQLDEARWLESRSPVTELSVDLEEASEMTIALKLATAGPRQSGPARIVTISEDPHMRNLTIAQDGTDLVLRMRSHLTGKNGTSPEFRFPGLFAASEQALVVTFDGLVLKIASSRMDSPMTIELLPGIAFIGEVDPHIGPYWAVHADRTTNWVYHLLFYGLFLLPLAILLSLPALRKWPRLSRLMLVGSILVGTPLLLEWVMVAPSGSSVRPLHILASIAVIIAIAWVLVPAIRWLINSWRAQ